MLTRDLDRREFLKTTAGAAWIASTSALAASAGRQATELTAGTAKVDLTPTRSRVCANGRKPDPPTVYAPIHARCLTLNDGRKRLVIVTYDFNCLDVATPILRERVAAELGIEPAYLVLLATHNHQSPIQIVPANFDYGRGLAL